MTQPQPAPLPDGTLLQPFVDVLPVAPRFTLDKDRVITASVHQVDLHADVKAVPVWRYRVEDEGEVPAQPILEAEEGEATRITWRNELTGDALPCRVVQIVDPEPQPPAALQQNVVGIAPAETFLEVAPESELVRRTVVHLHGGHSDADNDGWPENTRAPGEPQYAEYANTADNTATDLGDDVLPKAGAHQWFHDHAMGITGLHVYAGLVGTYLVRGRRERTLHRTHGLPITPESGEIVLVVADRNVEVSDGTATLLHKTTMETGEFFGPLTSVNGTIWPALKVQAGVVRLRVLNASNSRAYRLHLLDDADGDRSDRMRILGTEGGLLWKPVDVQSGGILLAPAERIDLLVRLTDLAGASLTLWNSAPAPFPGDGNPNAAQTPMVPDADNRRPYPQVMRIDVVAADDPGGDVHHAGPGWVWDKLSPDAILNRGAVRLVHDEPSRRNPTVPPPRVIEHHQHRVVVLSESAPPGHLQLTEFVPDPRGAMQLVLPGEHEPTAYAPIGSSFDDTVGITPTVGVWEVWRLVNTTGDTHPIHIHQSTFQPLGRFATSYTSGTYDQATRSTAADTPLRPVPGAGRVYERHETTGWKDTIRVDPDQMVSVAIRFDLTGRYVYHCHILEHEDREMMRPVVVSAVPMMPGMSM